MACCARCSSCGGCASPTLSARRRTSLRGATRASPEAALVVFARAPVPGRVKTRLAPLLGEKGAARLYERMIAKTLRTGRSAGFGSKWLFLSGTLRNRPAGYQLRSQGPGSLGERMHRAFTLVLKNHASAILIGSDCPALEPADLRAAARALRGGMDAVLLPAEDGGYALIGLARNSRRLFEGIDWGGRSVLAQTRRRLERLGWRWKELRTLWDVDRPGDVARLRREKLL
ncbi:MAG: TIGR04282 family arsenosugar biosynthesis glycosyltransferase [Pseudomonadota bacterium]